MDLFSLGGRRTLAAGVVVSIASAVAPAVLGSGAESARLDVLDSAAWLASESAGNVVRVNGQTGRVDARIDLGEVASDLTVAQARGTVLVGVGDQVRSIDVANLDWGAATDAKGELVVGDDAAYMVTAEGLVREVDAASLETKGEVDLGQAPGRGVVIGERLVVPLDDGTVAVVDGDEVAAEVDAGGDDDFLYVTAARRPGHDPQHVALGAARARPRLRGGDRRPRRRPARGRAGRAPHAARRAAVAAGRPLGRAGGPRPRHRQGAARAGRRRGPLGHRARRRRRPASTWSTRRPARSWPSTPPPAAWSGARRWASPTPRGSS